MLDQIATARAAAGDSLLTNQQSHSIESELINVCVTKTAVQGLETRVWQAGTRSDFGHRPKSESRDLWLPVQAKTTLKSSFPYRFYVRGEYDMDLACFPGHGCGGFVFSEQYMRQHKAKLYSGKCLYIAPGSAFDEPMLNWPDYAEKMLARWREEAVLHERDVAEQRTGGARQSRLRSEMELRMQCTEKSQCEVVTQSLVQALVPGRVYAWPASPNEVVDRFVDGLRVQDKVVQAVSSGAFQALSLIHI